MSDMTKRLLDQVINEKERAMEKSILLDQGRRDKYLINKARIKDQEELNDLYQQSRRGLNSRSEYYKKLQEVRSWWR